MKLFFNHRINLILLISTIGYRANGQACDCWIDPDVTYSISDPINWGNCDGAGGAGVDCWYGPFQLPFEICFYDTTYTEIYLTTKGTIALGEPYCEWIPYTFPGNDGDIQHNHICPFRADFDFSEYGQLFYKVTEDAFYLNYINVPYYYQGNKYNTFQVIIHASNNEGFGENNVQFCYMDMQWYADEAGGIDGCSGPLPAIAGADAAEGDARFLLGAFSEFSNNYDGPGGNDNGVYWLNGKSIEFNTCGYTAYNPPVVIAEQSSDTLYVCLNDTTEINLEFISPEPGQSVAVSFQQSGSGLSAVISNGQVASFNGIFVGSLENVGVHDISIIAIDDGLPADTTVVEYTLVVVDMEMPYLTIDSEAWICDSNFTYLNATEGFDTYAWNYPACDGYECILYDSGLVTLTATILLCQATASILIDSEPYFIIDYICPSNELCPGNSLVICAEECLGSYSGNIQWSVYPGYCGDILSENTNEDCIEVGSECHGTYMAELTNELGCVSYAIFVVQVVEIEVPDENLNLTDCDGLDEVLLNTAYSEGDGNLGLIVSTSDVESWDGCYIVVTSEDCNDEGSGFWIFEVSNSYEVFYAPISYCDYIIIDLWTSGNTPSGEVQINNCSNQNSITIENLYDGVIWEGTSACEAEPLDVEWTVEGPEGWTLQTANELQVEFSPGEFGNYTVCLNTGACSIGACYNLTYTLPPELNILGDNYAGLCGDSETICINANDIGGTGTITWTGEGVTPDETGSCAQIGPYDQFFEGIVEVGIANECGSYQEEISVHSLPTINDTLYFDGTYLSVEECECEYQWYFNGSPMWGEISNSVPAIEAGSYFVEISNDCFEEVSEEFLVESVTEITQPQAWVFFDENHTPIVRITNPKAVFFIEVLDIAGCKVFESNDIRFEMRLPNGLAHGIYSVSLHCGEGEIFTSRFAK